MARPLLCKRHCVIVMYKIENEQRITERDCTMRVAICDDEAIYREETKKGIRAYRKDIEIVEYTDGSELVQSEEQFDLIFLDVEMKKLDGVTTAKYLRRKNIDAEIVFLTSHGEFVYDAFDVRALQFLKKPLESGKLIKVLKTVEKALNEEDKVELSLEGEKCYVKVKDIVYLESYGDGVFVYDRFGTVYEERRGTLKHWNERLSGKGFVQIHRTYLISMFYVERNGDNHVKLKGFEERLEVSRRFASGYKETFMDFVRKNGRMI